MENFSSSGQRHLVASVVCVILLLFLLRFMDVPVLREMRELAFAPMQAATAEQVGLDRVAIVAIDEKSLREEGQWPWPRDRLADLVSTVAAADPAAIGLGFLTSEEDRLDPANDEVLAAAIRDQSIILSTAAAPVLAGERRQGLKLLEPTAVLSRAADGFGMITVIPESDGRVRAMPAKLALDDIGYPSFGVEMVRVALGEPAVVSRRDILHGSRLAIGDVKISPDRGGAVWMRFANGNDIMKVSAADVLSDPESARDFAGRLVVIGPTAAGLSGLSLSPQGDVLLDMELHAMFAANLIEETEFSRPLYLAMVETMLAAILAAATLFFYLRGPRMRVITATAIVMAMLGGLAALTFIFARQANMLFDWTLPAVALIVSGIVTLCYWWQEVWRRRNIQEQDRVTAMLMVRTSENARRNFYSNLSHELRTPLNMIVAGAEMIRDGVLGPVTPSEYSRYAEDIHESGVRITQMFENMIHLGNVKAERIRMEKDRFPLGTAVNHALLATGAPQAFWMQMPDSMPICTGDRKMIEIAVANVADNALKFRSGSSLIEVEGIRRAGRFEIAIEDDGVGLSDEQRLVIGQLHVDGNIHAARKTRGLGVGLALTRSIVELHGGDLGVERGRNGGYNRFILRIPSSCLTW